MGWARGSGMMSEILEIIDRHYGLTPAVAEDLISVFEMQDCDAIRVHGWLVAFRPSIKSSRKSTPKNWENK